MDGIVAWIVEGKVRCKVRFLAKQWFEHVFAKFVLRSCLTPDPDFVHFTIKVVVAVPSIKTKGIIKRLVTYFTASSITGRFEVGIPIDEHLS